MRGTRNHEEERGRAHLFHRGIKESLGISHAPDDARQLTTLPVNLFPCLRSLTTLIKVIIILIVVVVAAAAATTFLSHGASRPLLSTCIPSLPLVLSIPSSLLIVLLFLITPVEVYTVMRSQQLERHVDIIPVVLSLGVAPVREM